MSVIRHLLKPYLRLTEKRHLARAQDPAALRRSFEAKARIFFHAPRGARYRRATLAEVPVLQAEAREVAGSTRPRILYFHGGAYVFGSPDTHKAMLARLSAQTGLPTVLPKYRLAPEHRFPAALEDAEAVFRALAAQGPVILGGDSAGGGLALALLARCLDRGWPPPVGTFAFSPLTDMTFSGASLAENAAADVILPASRLADMRAMYLGDADPADPRASPLFADFSGATPVWLGVGDTEILLDDTRRLATRLRAQGVAVTEVVARDLPHVWPILQTLLPEARDTLRAVAHWAKTLRAVQPSRALIRR